jgi:hypothetical protein
VARKCFCRHYNIVEGTQPKRGGFGGILHDVIRTDIDVFAKLVRIDSEAIGFDGGIVRATNCRYGTAGLLEDVYIYCTYGSRAVDENLGRHSSTLVCCYKVGSRLKCCR